MTKKEKEIVGFVFQEIPLGEARNAVIAGGGDYAELKAKLLETLPALATDKAFAFGLPNGREIDEGKRRGICLALNAALKRAKIRWYVTYSGMKKVFLCVPREPKFEKVQSSIVNSGDDDKILKLRKSGMKPNEIAKELPDVPLKHIKYVAYQLFTKNKKTHDPRTQAFIDIARHTFKTSDFTSVALRTAISRVGIKTLGLTGFSLAPYLGISKSGVLFNANKKTKTGLAEIEKLTKAVQGRK